MKKLFVIKIKLIVPGMSIVLYFAKLKYGREKYRDVFQKFDLNFLISTRTDCSPIGVTFGTLLPVEDPPP